MSYRKDQGRYARMLAFWALVLLVTYGCFHGGGLATLVDQWMGESNSTLIDPFPLLGILKTSTCITVGVLVVATFAIHVLLARPKIADALIDTEGEMQKVTWPTWAEAWQGTVAVTVMVIVLFLFLTAADIILTKAMQLLVAGGV
ncbi:MAG: preprotein translocase subunit SecE [Planctomycetes bacterium]|nr:preprotein translocase subunit SecE [Planctomycetota bacterium]